MRSGGRRLKNVVVEIFNVALVARVVIYKPIEKGHRGKYGRIVRKRSSRKHI